MSAKENVAPEIAAWDVSPETAEVLIRDLMQTFQHIHLKVKGTCMSPVMNPGTRVTVSPTRLKPPRMGDVVLVRHVNGLKLHRVFWGPPLASGWRTRGDQSIGWDPWVCADSVLGTVVSIQDSPGQRVRFGLIKFTRHFIIRYLKMIRCRLKTMMKCKH